MTILKDFSVLWSLIHTLVMFLFLFESRYSKKKTVRLTGLFMLPLIILNFILFILFDAEQYIKLMLVTLSLPSFIFFWFLSKHRGGRFVFTFCLIDTIVLEVIYITNIIDHYIPGYWFMFAVRLVAYPMLEWLIYKKIRTEYREIQNSLEKGWWTFAFIGLMFYIAITLAMIYPTIITERPEYLPVLAILLVLMPVSYINIFNALKNQQRVFENKEQENILRMQVATIKSRVEEYSKANDKFSKERHDFRHKLQTISRMIETKKYDELLQTISQYNEALDETKVKTYCDNAVIDAVLSSYLYKAEVNGIKVTVAVGLPDHLPANDVELATALANAIENAMNAQEKVEPEKRHIEIKAISTPQFMIEVSNTFCEEIKFDDDEIPVTDKEGHGIGTRSIVAFCNKYNAFYEFKTKGDKFILHIMF